MDREEACAEKGRDEEPSNMVEKESKVQGILLAIVISDQVNWLEVLQKALCE